MNRYAGAAIAAGCAFAGLTFAVTVHSAAVTAVDTWLHTMAITARNDATISVARVVTEAGSTYIAIPAIAVLGYVSMPGRPIRVRVGAATLLVAVAAIGAAAGLAINAAVNGVRPGQADWAGAAGGPTFPSGHTTVATILGASIAWAVITRLGRHERWVVVVGLIVAVAVGISRVWLGVHWPSDVIGGWLFGLAWAALAIGVLSEVRRRDWRRLPWVRHGSEPGRRAPWEQPPTASAPKATTSGSRD